MSVKSGLGYSPLTGKIYWGRQNEKTGMWSGEKRDVTNMFLQVMEHKFPVGYQQDITVNGEHHSTIMNASADSKPYVVPRKIDYCNEMYERVIEALGIENETQKQADFIKFLCMKKAND